MAYNSSGPMGPAPRALRPIQVPGYGGAIPVSDGGTVSLIGFNFTPTPDGGFDVRRFTKSQLPAVAGVDLTSILRQCQVLAPLTGGDKGFPPPANNTCGVGKNATVLPNSTNPLAHLPVDPRGGYCAANPFNNGAALPHLGGPDGVFNAAPRRCFGSVPACGMMPPAERHFDPTSTGYGVPARPNYDAPWNSVARHEIPLHAGVTEAQYDCRVPMACPDMARFLRHPYEPAQMHGVPPSPRRSISPVPGRSVSPVPTRIIGPARRRSITPNSRRSLSHIPLDTCAQTAPSGIGMLNRTTAYDNRSQPTRAGCGTPRPRRASASPVPDESVTRGPGRRFGSVGAYPAHPAARANRKEQKMTAEALKDAHEVLSKVRTELETRDDIRSRMRPQDFKQFKAAVTQLETALDADKSGHRRSRSLACTSRKAQPRSNDRSPTTTLRRRPQ